jgi:hypothetical protein
LLIDIHPALDISVLINNLKTASARRARNRFADHLAPFYRKPLFWSRAHFVGSVGGRHTGNGARLRRRAGHCGARPEVGRKGKKQTCPLDPLLPLGFAYGFASEPAAPGGGMRRQ